MDRSEDSRDSSFWRDGEETAVTATELEVMTIYMTCLKISADLLVLKSIKNITTQMHLVYLNESTNVKRHLALMNPAPAVQVLVLSV